MLRPPPVRKAPRPSPAPLALAGATLVGALAQPGWAAQASPAGAKAPPAPVAQAAATTLTQDAAPKDIAVAILGLDAVEAAEPLAQGLTQALRQRAATIPGVRLLPATKDLVEVKLLFGCLDERPECLARAARAIGADRLVFGSLRRASDGFTVVLKQLDARTGTVERFISEGTTAKALRGQELSENTANWTKVLLGTALHGGLRVRSVPPGASVELDGKPAGQTPLQLDDVLAGPHTVTLSRYGHETAQRSVLLRGGSVSELDVTLRGVGGALPTPGAVAAQGTQDPGRALKIASFFLVGAAAIAGGVAIYTWRTYNGDGDTARGALDVLQTNYPNAPTAVNEFFASQDQLSRCQVPAALTAQAMLRPETSAAYTSYMDACRHGRTFANATTGLVATMGSLALLGVTTYIIGDRLSRKAGKDPKLGYTPRLTEVSPVVSAQGGGVNLSVRF